MKTFVVVTSISPPNAALRLIAEGCREHGQEFIVVGDSKSPAEFQLDGADFYSVDRQREIGSSYARLCLPNSYARKNIGYLLAMKHGADVIVETDDDNFPHEGFWEPRGLIQHAPVLLDSGWVNLYRYYRTNGVWPRGFPLDAIYRDAPELGTKLYTAACPIQQGLADENPDVDAIWRLLHPEPILFFNTDRKLILGRESWCPFNSQNTSWFPQAFPLMYLPAYCSIRMTDIWRSFVAQRICWENGWGVLFHGPTVHQERNEHDLMKDFELEIPGYLHNREIARRLEALRLQSGIDYLGENLHRCYEELICMGLVGAEESGLLSAWLGDLKAIRC